MERCVDREIPPMLGMCYCIPMVLHRVSYMVCRFCSLADASQKSEMLANMVSEWTLNRVPAVCNGAIILV